MILHNKIFPFFVFLNVASLCAMNTVSLKKLCLEKLPSLEQSDDPKIQCDLGCCYMYGHGVPKDTNRAATLFQKSACKDLALASLFLGYCYHDGVGVQQSYTNADHCFEKAENPAFIEDPSAMHTDSLAITLLKNAAKQENSLAQWKLAVCYQRAIGMQKDLSCAAFWCQKAAEQEYAPAQCGLGNYYLDGTGVEKDDKKALAWIQKAAQHDEPAAWKQLGFCYQTGRGVEQDFEQAVTFHKRAADLDLSEAQVNLGACYLRGTGVKKDNKLAITLFKKAADQKNVCAQFWLGHCYCKGLGVEKDVVQAATWYQKAAKQGNAVAQNELAYCYEQGLGIQKDPAQAITWLQKATEQKFSPAQIHLGYIYEYNKDYRSTKKATKWYIHYLQTTNPIPTTEADQKTAQTMPTCAICLNPLESEQGEEQKDLSCVCYSKHLLHTECIHGWKAANVDKSTAATCPLCRKELL